MGENITSDDSIGKATILTAEERMTEALDLIRELDGWSWENLEDFITVGVREPQDQRALFTMISDARNPAPGNQAANKPGEIQNLAAELRMAVTHSFNAVDHLGLSALGSMVFRPTTNLRSWHIYNPAILIANFEEGNFGRISGVPGSGKTNAGCHMILEWVRSSPNHIAFTNIKPKGAQQYANPHIIYVKDAKEFFLAISRLLPGERWIMFLDEGGLIYGKPDAATRRAKDLDKLMRIIRHLHGSFVIIEQRPESVPTILQEFATTILYCPVKLIEGSKSGRINIEMRGPKLAFRDRIKDFPPVNLDEVPFDTYDFAFWSVNINIYALFSAVAGSDDPYGAISDFIQAAHGVEGKAYFKTCQRCGKPLPEGHSRLQKFCSDACRVAAHEQKKRDEAELDPDNVEAFIEQEL